MVEFLQSTRSIITTLGVAANFVQLFCPETLVLVRTERLLEAGSLLGRFGVMPLHQSGVAEHSVDARGTSRHHLGVEHHEGETPVTLKRVLVVKLNDGLLFPVFEPPITGNPAVMLVHFAVALPPVIELALAETAPLDELPGRDLRPV
jgi:hypothetical protein